MTAEITRVIGIDPGSRLCGWAVIELKRGVLTHIDNGVIVVHAGNPPLHVRLARLFAALEKIITEHWPNAAAVENVFVGHGNVRSALALGQARGVILLALARAGLEPHAYSAQEVKKAATGSGRAQKGQVQQMVALRFDLPEIPQEDAADAVAVALCHAQNLALGLPIAAQLPPKPPRKKRGRAGLAAFVAAREAEEAKRTTKRTPQ